AAHSIWQDPGLAALARYNARSSAQLDALVALPEWVAFAYNPPGVVVGADGFFQLLDAANPTHTQAVPARHTLPQPDVLPSFDLRWTPQDAAARYNAHFMTPPSWDDFDGWRSLAIWQPATSALLPLAGFRSPDALDGRFAYPLSDVSGLADLLVWIDSQPTTQLGDWLAHIDRATLPSRPEAPPADAKTWLMRWFTTDTLPVWERLRDARALPTPPKVVGLTTTFPYP
ncbi:MAG: hypothetical protein H7Y11_02665, partial [Armatimonadetes bacterium]|nr:hypothetical protein [Anaerolineae bacterium]